MSSRELCPGPRRSSLELVDGGQHAARQGDRGLAQPAPAGFDVDVVIVPQAIALALGNLQDGAVCMLNRQPTLGVGSIFAVRARVSRNPRSYVLQVSPWLCESLNLDFDVSARRVLAHRASLCLTPVCCTVLTYYQGDEVNLHVIKTQAAQIEASEAAQIETQARVNQDPVVPHDSQRRPGLESASLPATAWPRQARGTAPRGQRGFDEGTYLCLARFVPEYDSGTMYPACGLCPRLVRMQTVLFCYCCCRLGCRFPT